MSPMSRQKISGFVPTHVNDRKGWPLFLPPPPKILSTRLVARHIPHASADAYERLALKCGRPQTGERFAHCGTVLRSAFDGFRYALPILRTAMSDPRLRRLIRPTKPRCCSRPEERRVGEECVGTVRFRL